MQIETIMKQVYSFRNKTLVAFCSITILLFSVTANAQVKVGDNPNTIKTASLIEMESTNKGLVFPRVSLTSLASAAPLATDLLEATVVYNTNAALPGGTGLYIWSGGTWKVFTTGTAFSLPALTNGSVVFSNGTTLAQNNSQFFWDNTNNRLGLGTTSPNTKLDVAGAVSIVSAGGSLQLKGTGNGSHTFAEFYPNGNGSTRSAYIGYGGNGATQLSIVNEISNGDMALSTGQDLYLSAGAKGRLMLQGSTGNVGINTTSTSYPVTIQAAAGNTALLGFYNNASTDKYNFSLINGGLSLNESGVFNGRLFIKDGGNVGIGNTNPAQKLDVSGIVQISGSGNGLKFPDGTLQTTAAVTGFTLPALNNGSVLFSNGSTIAQNNANFFWDNTNSRLGIGTSSPGYKLDVNGTPNFKSDGASLQLKSTGNGNHTYMEIYPNGEGTSRGGFVGYPANGSTTLALRNELANGNVAMLTTNDINLLAGLSNVTLQGSTGNVGIGTVTPSALLDVNGSTRLRGLTTAGVVVTDANGNLSSSPTYGLATASNGLNTLGSNVSLGGTLSQNTTIDQDGKSFNIQNSSPFFYNISNTGSTATNYVLNSGPIGQTFTLAQTATITSITFNITGSPIIGSVLLSLYSGNGSTVTYAESVTITSNGASTLTLTLTTPQVLPAGTHRFQFSAGSPSIIFPLTSNTYSGGASTVLGGIYDMNFEVNYTVYQTVPTLYASSAGNVGIGTETPSFKLDVNGGIRCVGAVNTTSDARLKQNIRPVGNALQNVLKLNGVRYTFRDAAFPTMNFPKGEQIGVLAQEVEKVYPELVSTDDKGYKSVNYAQLNAVLIEAIKEQQKEIEAAKTKNTQLEKDNTAIKQDLETLKAQVKLLAEKLVPSKACNQ
jgi:hypothetical protein